MAAGAKGVGMVVAGVSIATGMTVLRDLLYGNINVKPIIGGFAVGTFLLIIAFWSVEVASAFALLMLAASALTNAPLILTKVDLS